MMKKPPGDPVAFSNRTHPSNMSTSREEPLLTSIVSSRTQYLVGPSFLGQRMFKIVNRGG
jgi:hypothetical protein